MTFAKTEPVTAALVFFRKVRREGDMEDGVSGSDVSRRGRRGAEVSQRKSKILVRILYLMLLVGFFRQFNSCVALQLTLILLNQRL